MHKILLLGSDINVYYMARCYHELYHEKADVLGKEPMRFTDGSNIINISYNEKKVVLDIYINILNIKYIWDYNNFIYNKQLCSHDENYDSGNCYRIR